MLNIPAETIFEVADVVEIAEKIGIKLNSIDKIYGENERKKKAPRGAPSLMLSLCVTSYKPSHNIQVYVRAKTSLHSCKRT